MYIVKNRIGALLRSALLVAFAGLTVYAQSVSGTLQGTVQDSNNSVIPNAEIKIRNVATGAEQTTASNAEGLYRFPTLAPGQYSLTVSANGFKRSELTNISINIGVTGTLDITLQAGSVQEIVEISAEQTVVETETAQISNNFTGKQILSIPVNVAGGGIDTLALLSPGVVGGVGGGFGNTNGTTIFSNGGRSRANNFNIDGQDNNDLTVAGPASFVNNQDAVGEFQIVTNGFSAEFGQASGSVVNIVTKGGTNQYHGTAAYFYRNRKLFDTLTNQERRIGRKEAPALTNQTFSYTIGGPVIKDKLLFFNSYLGQRQPSQVLAQSGAGGFTPTPAGIQAMLAIPGLSPAAAATIRRMAPFNIAIGNPVIQPATSANLAPRLVPVTVGTVTRDIEFAPIQRQLSNPFTENQTQTRIDWNMNDKSRLSGTHFYQKQTNVYATGSLTNGFAGDVPSNSNRFGINHYYTFSSRFTNEFRFSYATINVTFGGNQLAEAAQADQDVPSISFGAGFLGWGTANNLPQGRLNKNYQYVDNFSMTFGAHRMKTGIDFRYRKSDLIFLPNVNGTYNFLTAGTTSGWSFFAQNNPSSVSITLGPIGSNLKDFQHYYFFQDDWKIKSNLTLYLGARYENFGQPINLLHDTTLARESNAQTAFYNTSVPVEQRIVPKTPVDSNNFAPRLGFAYSPSANGDFMRKLIGSGNDFVIRGNFAVAYDLAFYNILLNMQTAAPVVLAAALQRGNGVVLPNEPTGPAVRAALGQFVPLRTVDPRTLVRTSVSPTFRSPYTMQWSLGFQRQVGRHHGIELGYVATRSLQQFRTINANPNIAALFAAFPNLVPSGVRPVANDNPVAVSRGRIFPGEGLIRMRDNGAQARYDSMQAQYTARFSSLSTIINYTLAKQTDTGTDIFGTGIGNTIAQNPFDLNAGEAARGFLDFRHNLSLSFVYQIPGFKDQKGVVGRLLGGWQVSGTYRALPGQPYAVQQFNFGSPYSDTLFAQNFIGGADGALRPFRGNVNANPKTVGLDNVTARARFATLFTANPNAPASAYYSLNDLNNGRITAVTANDVRFIANTAETARIFGTPWGNEPRNSLIGDDFRLGNFSLFKDIKITRGFYSDQNPITLQFRADMFNVFNNTNLGIPTFNIDNAGINFADITENTGGRRTVQFGLKLIF